jgi:rod shape-determining protein MreC
MKSLSPFQKWMSALFAAAFTLILILNIIQYTAPITGANTPGYSLFSNISYALVTKPITAFSEFNAEVASFWKTKAENEILRREVDKLSQYQAALEEAYREIEALKDLNELGQTYADYRLLKGTIINRSVDSFSHVLLIDLGSEDGIALDDAVVSTKGLIGKVIEVNPSSSVVLLLTTEESMNKVTVKIQLDAAKTAEAILDKYDPNIRGYVLKLLDTGSTITVGMKVVTSGLGGAFPSGLLVGTVSQVETLNDAVGLKITVDPAADFFSIDYIAVVKRNE